MADTQLGKRIVRDADGQRVQVPSSFQCHDDTATPIESPVAFDTDVDALKIPVGALVVYLTPTEDLRVSFDGNDIQSTITDGHYLCLADQETPLPVAGKAGSNLYFTQVTGGASGSLYFRFDMA